VNKEDAMTDKQSTTRSSRKKRRSADQLAVSTRQNSVELDEADLKKVSGGASDASPALMLHNINGRHIKEGLLS
jgi:hypothetical protein